MIRTSQLALLVALLVAACTAADGGRDAVSDTDVSDTTAGDTVVAPDADEPDAAEDATPDVVEDVAPDVAPDVVEDVAPDVDDDVVPDVLEDVAPDVDDDVVPDVVEDAARDVAEDVSPDVADDVSPDVVEDVAPDVVEDVAPDVEDVAEDVVEDVAPDVVEDVAPDVPEDVDADVTDAADGDVDDTAPDAAHPCASLPDGTVLSTTPWGACGNFEDACRTLGTRERDVVVCRGGGPTTDIEVGGCSDPDPTCEDGILTRRVDGLPVIHDYSGADPLVVDALIERALDGMGLSPTTGPELRDRVYVNRWMIVWIDETGFYGKANGLWALNGDVDALDFVLVDHGRPVNTFVVGEHGDGAWPAGYMGAEHIEFPNNVPEPDDDPSCADSLCAQYSLNEAHTFSDPDIPTWRACNDGSPSFAEHFTPDSIVPTADGFQILYEGRLTKEGDFGGSTSGSNCHADFLFPDGERREVYLRVGYEFRADATWLDRLLQVRNPAGNPVFDGPFGFIGGFVMTEWPEPHARKQLHRYVRVPDRAVEVGWGDTTLTLEPDRWIAFPPTVPTRDVVLGWAGQPVTLSAYDNYAAGEAYTLSNEGVTDNGDTGFCLCYVHGGIEQGGALVHDPVAPGAKSEVGVRRLFVHNEDAPAPNGRWVFEAERDLAHNTGYLDEDGWAADTATGAVTHMVYGPYTRALGEGLHSAEFDVLIDFVDERTERIVALDVYDVDAGEVIGSRDVRRVDFRVADQYQTFIVDFDMTGRAGHAIETRVYYERRAYVRVDRVVIVAR